VYIFSILDETKAAEEKSLFIVGAKNAVKFKYYFFRDDLLKENLMSYCICYFCIQQQH